MRKRLCAGMLAAVTAFFTLATPAMAYAQKEGQDIEIPVLEEGTYVKGEALVSLTATQAAALTKEGKVSFDKNIQIEECWNFGPSEEESSERVQDYVALVHSDRYTTEELMETVSGKFYVDAVAPNSYIHLCDTGKDPLSDYQWYLNGTGAMQANSAGISHDAIHVAPSAEPVVAVVDTGVDYTNEELQDAMWVNPYRGQGLEGKYGYDFANADADPMDTVGHGTHCAGIIAAQQDNKIGIKGISNAKIMALKVVKDGEDTFDTASVVAAFEYVVQAQQLGVKVAAVNCSWGGGHDIGSILDTLIDKMGENGTLTTFAAGNDAVNWDKIAAPMRQTPYDLKSKYVVVVGASNENDRRAEFSDYGNTQVDLFAPGSNILSTVHKAKFLPQFWEQEKREEMVLYYNSFQDIEGLYTAADLNGLETEYTVKLEYEPGVGFSDMKNGSLKYTVKYNKKSGFPWSFNNTVQENGQEQAGFIYLDVTSMHLDPNQTYYISCMMTTDVGDGPATWETVEKVSSAQDSRFVQLNGRDYLALIGMSLKKSKTETCYFDNIAVSVANPDVSKFEKCDLQSGTSMAGPMVSGAIAVIRGANPDLPAQQIRNILMDCTRSTSAVENECVTGGILDLSGVAVKAARLKLNKKTASVRYGHTLQLKATISPANVTNAAVKWISSNNKYATVTSAGKVKIKKAGIGKEVKITAVTKDGTKLKKVCNIKILKAKKA